MPATAERRRSGTPIPTGASVVRSPAMAESTALRCLHAAEGPRQRPWARSFKASRVATAWAASEDPFSMNAKTISSSKTRVEGAWLVWGTLGGLTRSRASFDDGD